MTPKMKLSFAIATETDAAALALLGSVTNKHWLEKDGRDSAKAVVKETRALRWIKQSRVLMARRDGEIIAMLSLAKKKPWAIDPAYFTTVPRPIYLTTMMVAPQWQHQGVGRQLLDEARAVARNWLADAIRLDAYDNETGAGGFYQKCGYREVGRKTYRETPLIYFELLL